MRIVLILLVFVISSLVIAKQAITNEKMFVCSGYNTIETFSESDKKESVVIRRGSFLELSFTRTNDSLKHLLDEPEYGVFVDNLYYPSEEVKVNGNIISAIYAHDWMPIKFRYDLKSNMLYAYHEKSDCFYREPRSHHSPVDPATCVKTSSVTFKGVCSIQSNHFK